MKHLVTISLCFLALSVSVYGQGACNNQTSVTHQGYEYDIVEIGDQCWFSENCRYLPSVSPSIEGSEIDSYYYVHGYEGNDVEAAKLTENFETYGVLYNWPAVMTEGICPSGWHIPSDGEWTQLTDFLGGEVIAGGKMKATSGWNNDGNGSNSSGFNGLPGGYRYGGSGGFSGTGYYGYWWSSTTTTTDIGSMEAGTASHNRKLPYAYDFIMNEFGLINQGFAARCIQNALISGCTDIGACNYDSNATSNDGSCEYLTCAGCTTSVACNYDPEATIDDGSCEFICEGCTDEVACNYDPSANVDDSSCEYLSCAGCTDAVACNFNLESTIDDGSCLYPEQYYDCFGGCVNDSDSDGICDELEIPGCTDEGSCNFNLEATDDDGSCEYITCAGCQYEFACNYDPDATIADNESCEYGTCPGCTDSTACNYNPTVSEDDGSCSYNIDAIGICGGSCTSDSNNDGICDIQLCPEDLNGDGVIGVQDLLLVLSEFGCASSCENDINQDGYVAVQDILLLLSGFGSTCEISGFQNCGDLIEHEGYNYSTVLIGEQCWFSENCRYLPVVSNPSASSETSPYYFVYGYCYGYEGCTVEEAQATDNYATYGVLYNWPAVMTEGICPSGWHIPSDEEWQALEMSLGMSEAEANSMFSRGTDEGYQMKSTSGWNNDGNGSNSSGFTGLPGGYASLEGGFDNGGYNGYWWSGSSSGSYSWKRSLSNSNDDVYRSYDHRHRGYSARCVQD